MNLFGSSLRNRILDGGILPLLGVYDVFSASIAAAHTEGLFLSGFGFAASHYGLPDRGFVAWTDVIDFCRRVRAVAPRNHIVVDIDDGFADADVAVHVTQQLEFTGASGVILEDQARPRKCGHTGGKNILPLDLYLDKLSSVLECRNELFVIARTDTSEPSEIHERVMAFSETDADAILVDGQTSLDSVRRLRESTNKPLVFNQILGGRSPSFSLTELEDAGVSLSVYSTPLLFAAQAAMERCMEDLKMNDMRLDAVDHSVQLPDCQSLLETNWNASRKSQVPNGIPPVPTISNQQFQLEEPSGAK